MKRLALLLLFAVVLSSGAEAQCGYCGFMPPYGCNYVASCDFKCTNLGGGCSMYPAPGCEGVMDRVGQRGRKPTIYTWELGQWMVERGVTKRNQIPNEVLQRYRDKTALGRKFESFQTEEEAEAWLLSQSDGAVRSLRATN